MGIPPNGIRLRTPWKTWLSTVILGVLAAIALDIAGGLATAGDAVRVTTSFDVKYASAVLRQVSKVFSAGFGQAEANRVDQDINGLKPDEPKVWQFTVQFKGKPEQFEIRALKCWSGCAPA